MAPQTDPYADIAVPAPAPVAASSVSTDDPYASIATPAPAAPGILAQAGKMAGDVATGFGAGAVDTISGVGHLLNKLPVVGETLAPSEGIASLDKQNQTTGTAQAIGKGLEGIAEFETGDAALDGLAQGTRLVSMAKKYPLIAEVLDKATAHPWLAKIITEGLKGGVVGGTVGAAKGAQQGNAVGGAETGAALGGAAGVAKVGLEAAAANNPFRGITKGKAAAQAPAEAAIREGVEAGNTNPNLTAGIRTNPILDASTGNDTVLTKPLADLQAKSKAAYQAVDKVAGFDLKETKLGLANDQYALKQLGNTPEDVVKRKALQTSIADTQTRVRQAEAALKAQNIDPKAADALNTSLEAGRDFQKMMVRATSSDGSVNVDKLLNDSKVLRFNKRGDRLAQFMGKQGANDYIAALEDAQKQGVQGLKARAIAKFLAGGIVGAGTVGEGIRLLTSK